MTAITTGSNVISMDSRGKEDAFEFALRSNKAWARYKSHQNPAFFERLATGESPTFSGLDVPIPKSSKPLFLGSSQGM